jgi:phospholipid/cholesterol/gamma-HCH transport system substrate-binding protein
VVLIFFAGCLAIFIWFLQGTATRVPLVESKGYQSTVKVADVDNIVPASDVRMAGVAIGEVRAVRVESGGAVVDIAIDREGVAPLHEGVTVRVGNKSLIGDSYLEIVDGQGAPIPDGGRIPDSAVVPSTQLDDVITSLDPPTRDALGSMLRSVGAGTAGTHESVDLLAGGLGDLGREGQVALDAVAAQSEDLRALGKNTEALMEALDTGEGQIATLVTSAQQLTAATAGQRESLENTMRMLPDVLKEAQTTSGKIPELSTALTPVAADLQDSAPALSSALEELRPTTADLRGLLPAASGTLDSLPATLDRVPTFGSDLRNLVPGAMDLLADANPMLAYAKPYGPELAAFFANFNSVLQYQDEAGIHYARLMPMINEASEQTPLKSELLGVYNNPIPGPGTGGRPGPFQGEYPRVERLGN